jgi:hypothetical protein
MIAHRPLHRSGLALLTHPALASGADALAEQGIWMMNFWFWQPALDQSSHSFPSTEAFLTSSLKRAKPVLPYLESKCMQCSHICWYAEISIIPTNYRLKPFSNFRNRLMHSSLQFDFHFFEFSSHFLSDGFTNYRKHSIASLLPHKVGIPKKIKTLWLSCSTFDTVFDRERTKFNQARFPRVKRKRKFLESRVKLSKKLLCNFKSLKSNYKVVSPSHNDNIATLSARSPTLHPQIKHVVQINICQQWGNYSTGRCPFFTTVPFAFFHNSSGEPLYYQSHNAFVRYSMFDEFYQPRVVDVVKEPLNIGIQNIAHFLRLEAYIQRIQAVMLASLWPISIRESKKIFFIDRAQNSGRSTLNDFVFQYRQTQSSLLPISLWYVRSLYWFCLVGASLKPKRKISQIIFKIFSIVPPRHTIDSSRRFSLEVEICFLEHVDGINMMHQSRESLFIISYCYITYPLERTLRTYPALYPACVLLLQISFGQLSFLHCFREYRFLCGNFSTIQIDTVVQQLRRYYTTVRLPMFVHHCITSSDFTTRSSYSTTLEEHGISRFSRERLMHMHGVNDLAKFSDVLPYRHLKYCLPHSPTASAPRIVLTRLFTQPIHIFVNASPISLRISAHDSSPMWVATPSLSGTFIRQPNSPVYPGALEIKND